MVGSGVLIEGEKVMKASSLVGGILDSSHHEGRLVFLMLVGAVFVLVGAASHSANAYPTSCNSFNKGCSYQGVPVPCSNTEYCYTYDGGAINCTYGGSNSAPVTNYRNNSPPSSWANCQAASGGAACADTIQPCGADTLWYWDDQCTSPFICSAPYYYPYCEGPATPSC